MTVAELKAILDTLPDDTEVLVSHGNYPNCEPELFEVQEARSSLVIIPSSDERNLGGVRNLLHWRHISKASET